MLIRIICFSNKKATRRVALVLVQLSLFVGGVILGRVYNRHPEGRKRTSVFFSL